MTKAAAAVITHEVYRRTSLLFWRHTTSCRGAPPGILLQLALHSGWPPPDDHAPDALDPPPPERLSPREAWLLRGGAVLRAHDVLPHFRGACLALTWKSFPGCNICPHRGRRHARSHCPAAHDFSP